MPSLLPGPRPRERSLRTVSLVLLLVTFAACGTCGPCGTQPEPQPTPVASVVQLSGTVTLQRGGKTLPVTQGTPLLLGDLLITGPQSSALLRTSQQTELSLGESTRFRLDGDSRTLRLHLEEGSVLSRTPRGGPVKGTELMLQLLTPHGATTLTQGTELSFELSPSRAGMKVLLGELTLVGKDGKEVRVVAGETLELPLGQPRREGSAAPAAGVVTAEPLELTLSAQRGKPLVRAKEAPRFVPAPREPSPVAEGTAFRVPARARALLASRGLRAHLGDGSQGSIGPAVSSAEGERYALSLEAGRALLDFTEGPPRELVLTGRGQRLQARATEDAAASVVQGPGGARVEVHTGQLELTVGGEKRRVKAGEVARLEGSGLVTVARARPALVLPMGSKLRVHANVLREVALSVPKQEAPVHVEVAANEDFSERLMAGRVDAAHVVVPAPPPGGALFWRARGAEGNVLGQGQARFLADRDSSRRTQNAHAEVHETGQRASIYFQSTPPAVSLSYLAHAGARQYRVRVYRAGQLSAPLLERTVTETRCTFAAGALGEGDYVWYATPLDASGAELAGGRMNRLELVYDNSRRTLSITRPRPGERVGPSGTEVQGVAPLDSKLFVNGQPVALDAKGRFTLRVPRTEALIFRLVSEKGSESYWVRHLRGER